MQSRSVSRELALLMLGQIHDRLPASDLPLDALLQQALASLGQHVREALDSSALDLQQAQQELLDSELIDGEAQLPRVRRHLQSGLTLAEQAINRLSAGLELPRLLMLADQEQIRRGAVDRARAVLEHREQLDQQLDGVMEGWRLTRLPRIDRDILRLAAVDLQRFGTPAAVACNEAVELANRYSDEQGRRMINGILRRLTTAR
ncbi:transcription antitermination factor NusB [Synechococcus sp. CS-1325]|uniref:transcription antitermination factor NusB n=1 Tax=unclassified Synechococcus TaxID=2626047 RepID=UPI000DAFCFF4|nr:MULTISPECIES: transcription antitermination factor NusB [unclassified Synechococcus]PZV02338.1 MAG: transcription antitermination factor NusB [Cyanobium sp.]MCT0199172.1 transcription antitermination factor NusB [Synechococcus sp. CS-1325]MCT0214649.1 transcription antitermination factor NusB [Synechococcus sp. CS-1326]MCT0231161.1 transcription antitermination factor NusB [Synechococcus sp. CS-1324]MCT0233983.1 transcription antitermination factor NusB [Synechococcus sp. CS-1327]